MKIDPRSVGTEKSFFLWYYFCKAYFSRVLISKQLQKGDWFWCGGGVYFTIKTFKSFFSFLQCTSSSMIPPSSVLPLHCCSTQFITLLELCYPAFYCKCLCIWFDPGSVFQFWHRVASRCSISACWINLSSFPFKFVLKSSLNYLRDFLLLQIERSNMKVI